MRQSIRRTVCVLAALALAPAAAAGAATTPTKARARAFAMAVNLTAADLPGFRGTKRTTSSGETQFGAMVAKCAGSTSPSLALIDSSSDDFSMMSGRLGELDVSSNVTVVPSAKLAAQDLRAVRSARGRSCLAAATTKLVKSMRVPGIKFGAVSVGTLRRTAKGSNGSFGLRFKVVAQVGGLKVPFYIDSLGFTRGPAEVGLTTLGIEQPFPATQEQNLLTLLAGRAAFNPIQ